MTKTIKQLKKRLLFSIIEILSSERFDTNIISKGCRNIGIQTEYARLLFPNGRFEVLDEFGNCINKAMIKRIKKELTITTSITTRIFESLKIRFEILDKYKFVLPKIITFYLKPWNHIKFYPYIWNIMNLIWRVGGKDQSTDIHYYTKRGLLVGIYLSTLVFWLSDKSVNYQDTYSLLYKKLRTVVSIGRKVNSFPVKP